MQRQDEAAGRQGTRGKAILIVPGVVHYTTA